MTIGHKIRKIRESKGIKQQTIADLLGITQPAYQKMESGGTKIRFDDLVKIAEELKIPLEEFTKEEVAIHNIQYNKHESSGNVNFMHNTFENERKVWEKLVESKNSEIETLKQIILNTKK